MFSLTSPFPALPSSSPIIDWWTIELGNVQSGGSGPIWPQSDGVDSVSSGTPVIVTALVLIVLALLLLLVLSVKEKAHMPSSSPASNKTAETPAHELPFPGKLVEGKYDVQYLHL